MTVMSSADYFFWTLAGVLGGVLAASFIQFTPIVIGVFLFVAAFLLVFGFFEDKRWLLIGFIVIGVAIGLARTGSGAFPPPSRKISDIGMLAATRQLFDESLTRVLPEPEVSFARGILIGRSPSFPKDLNEAMRKTSTVHLVAVSGYNISIVAIAIVSALEFLTVSRRFSWLIATIGIIVYTTFVGAPASAVRAAIMGILFVTARHFGRVSNARNALTLAAGAMVLHNPTVLRWDLGFQLSFLATIGLLWISPRIAKRLDFSGPNLLTDMLGAQLMVMPWIFYKFGTITLVGLGANMLVMSLTPLTMFWSFLAGFVGALSDAAAYIFAPIAFMLLRYNLWVIDSFAKVPLAAFSFALPSLWFVILMYGGIAYTFFKPDAKAQ